MCPGKLRGDRNDLSQLLNLLRSAVARTIAIRFGKVELSFYQCRIKRDSLFQFSNRSLDIREQKHGTEVRMRISVVRMNPGSLAEFSCGFFVVTVLSQNKAHIVVSLGIVGAQTQRLTEFGQNLIAVCASAP